MRKPRAIVCDDEEAIQDLLRHILEKTGYEVLTADTPIACPIYAKNFDSCTQQNRCADILITDHKMPDMTGLELLEMQQSRGCKLKSNNKALITGDEDPEIIQRVTALGCNYFSKPLQISSLLAWLKECEKGFDLTEPLASDLYLPAKKKSLRSAT